MNDGKQAFSEVLSSQKDAFHLDLCPKIALLFLLFIGVASARTLTFEGSGASMDGNITVNLSNNNGTSTFYTESFTNAVSNGTWFVVLGRANTLTLNTSTINYFSFSINGTWYDFNDTGTKWHDIGALGSGTEDNGTIGGGVAGFLAEWLNDNTLTNSPIFDGGTFLNFSNKNITGVDTLTASNGVWLNGALNGSTGAYNGFMPDNYFSTNGSSGGYIIGVNGKPVWSMLTYPNENANFFYIGFNHKSGDIAFTLAQSGRVGVNKQTNILMPDSGYTAGSTAGADDMRVGGTYSGDYPMQFEVVAQNGSVFKYRTNIDNRGWSAYSSNITMSTSPINLTLGVNVVFGNVSGHGTNATWYFTAFSQVPSGSFTINPTAFTHVFLYTGTSFRDITFEAGTTGGNMRTLMNTTSQYLYAGRPVPFRTAYFQLSTVGVNITLITEYWNGTGWATLGTAQAYLDNTANLTKSGAVSWDSALIPLWTNSKVNLHSDYWVRFSSTSTPATPPQAYSIVPQGVDRFQVYAAPFDITPVFAINPNGDMTTTGTVQAKGFYGEIYDTTNGRTLTLTSQNVYYNITNWTTGELSGWTNTLNNVLVCTTSGLYQVQYTVNGQLDAANELLFRLAINNTGEPKSEVSVRTIANQDGIYYGSFLKRFNVGDKVYLQVNNTAAAGKTLTTNNKNLILIRTGN